MNKYLFGAVRAANGFIKTALLKLAHGKSLSVGLPAFISPYTELTVERGTEVRIGKRLKMRSASKIRVRRGARLIIGRGFNMSGRNWITVRKEVTIGDNVTFGPGVMIYDHDHDFKTRDGIRKGLYNCESVHIGNNVWIGADCLILRGTEIGDNSVVAAGTVLRGKYGSDLMIYQKRTTETRSIEIGEQNNR